MCHHAQLVLQLESPRGTPSCSCPIARDPRVSAPASSFLLVLEPLLEPLSARRADVQKNFRIDRVLVSIRSKSLICEPVGQCLP
jgi:hypothetical protein